MAVAKVKKAGDDKNMSLKKVRGGCMVCMRVWSGASVVACMRVLSLLCSLCRYALCM